MERKLVMSFKDQVGSKFNLIVNSIKEEVTEAEIEAIMDSVISTGAVISNYIRDIEF